MTEVKGSYSKYSRLALFVVFAAVVYLIARNISTFSNVLLVLLGFGAVVLVHEFGHFIVAKLAGIKVEAFSIFMPPILLGVQRTENGFRFRILPKFFPAENDKSGDGSLSFTAGKKGKAGETEYRIGLIPFGGFVKLLGQEDTGPVKTSDDPRSFANKPLTSRAVVLAAGVVFNAISAIVVFMIVFLIGINLPPPMVGAVMPNSPAERAGLKPGDEIIEIAGKGEGLDFSNIGIAAALSGRDEAVALKVKHEDGSEEDLALVAERLPGMPMRSFGIWAPATLTIARLSKDDADILFERTGLRPGDRIKAINGREVQTHWELEEIVQNAFIPAVTLLAERTGPASKAVTLIESQLRLDLAPTRREVESESAFGDIYSMVPRLRIIDVSDRQDSNDAEPCLQNGDILLAIGNIDNPTYEEMREVITEYEDRKLPITVLRADADDIEKELVVTVVPRRSKDSGRVIIGVGLVSDLEHAVVADTIAAEDGSVALAIPRGAVITAVDGTGVSSFYDVAREIGQYAGQRVTIDWRIDEKRAGDVALNVGTGKEFATIKSNFAEPIPFKRLERLYKASGPIGAIKMGYRKTIMFIAQTYATLKSLVGGLVSPKELMGPAGILAFSYRVVSEQPLIYYVYFLGLISAVIAVFNFLPLPPLDGGLVVLLLVEKIKGSALGEKTQGVIAYVGWAFILAFLLYVTFNDIVRTFFS